MTAIELAHGGLITIADFDPKQLISANRRIHHHQRAQVCSYWRELARKAVLHEYGTADAGCSWHQRVRIVVTVRFPDLRRRDVGNLYPYVAKPIVDGLVDGRLVPDDDDRHVIGPDMRRDPERGPHRITIRIEDA